MAGEVDLARGREDPQAVGAVLAGLGRGEGRLRVVRFRGDALHRLVGERRADHDRELVARVAALREDVHQVEAVLHGQGPGAALRDLHSPDRVASERG
jgi:hypothetical protein